MNHSLRQRLEKLDRKASAPTNNLDDAEARERLRTTLAAEFGISAQDVWRHNDCPALCLLHRVCDGIATAAEVAQFDRIAEVPYFIGCTFSTADYLRSVSKIHREF